MRKRNRVWFIGAGEGGRGKQTQAGVHLRNGKNYSGKQKHLCKKKCIKGGNAEQRRFDNMEEKRDISQGGKGGPVRQGWGKQRPTKKELGGEETSGSPNKEDWKSL